ncbi:MAG: hypothetical protein ACQEXX_02025 [Bacillota bacterium]
MPIPSTTGQLRSNIKDMQIGDYIVWRVDSSGTQIMDGTLGTTEVPITGLPNSTNLNGYYWYGIKVDKGLIISDRVRAHTVTWDYLNTNKLIQGTPMTISGVDGTVRSLTGGVAYADENGNKSLTDAGSGAWPTNNEWDEYIVGFPQNKIQSGKTIDDVFHWNGPISWCQDTMILGIVLGSTTVTNAFRTFRGRQTINHLNANLSSTSAATIGFRPVLEYREV